MNLQLKPRLKTIVAIDGKLLGHGQQLAYERFKVISKANHQLPRTQQQSAKYAVSRQVERADFRFSEKESEKQKKKIAFKIARTAMRQRIAARLAAKKAAIMSTSDA